MSTMTMTWAELNQAVLVREFAVLRLHLGEGNAADIASWNPEELEYLPAIDRITRIFDLSTFERDLLLLCAGLEMDAVIAERCGELTGRPQKPCVTFSLAMSVLSDPHWSALAPSSPLRRYRLIEVEDGHGLTAAPLRIDERILHALAGVNTLDQRLGRMLRVREPSALVAGTQRQLAAELVEKQDVFSTTALHLFGDDPSGQESIAAMLSQQMGRDLYVLRVEDTPATSHDLEQFLTLWTREAMLLPAALVLQWENEVPGAYPRQLAERLPAPFFIASRDPLRLNRALQAYEVAKAAPAEQAEMWRLVLGDSADASEKVISRIAQQFRLSAETMLQLGTAVPQSGDETFSRRLWSACRSVARPRLETMAQRIEPQAWWDDLIVPDLQEQTLHQLAAQARNRMTVYEDWGFAGKGRRGLGLSALFSGPSGTGKTLAAEVLAKELELDLYRIDLSSVVSKYIGETEKNLKQIFDAAETGGVLLLFDEADAIFGKRAEVKDSHDRYANIEVGYLLQRIENFQGIAVLTTNIKSSLDKAFQRRLRFVVDFPFPDTAQRASIWQKSFPAQTPTRGIVFSKLANLNMSGGNIRNIALNAAFMAAEEGSAVDMSHILKATRLEALKAERPIAEVEIKGWI